MAADTVRMADAALKGAAAGALGAFAMMLTSRAENAVILPRGDDPQEPTTKMAEELAQRAGAELSERQAAVAGTGLGLGYGALMGAAFGVVQNLLHPPELLHGAVLGGISYATTVPERGVLPRMGVEQPPQQQSLERAAIPIGAHLVFGVVTAAAFSILANGSSRSAVQSPGNGHTGG